MKRIRIFTKKEMKVFGFRIILDFKQADIFRDIEISDQATFEDFHNAIIHSFALEDGEMASFYKSDDHWNQGEEISLFAMNDDALAMSECTLEQICSGKGDKFLYIFDFLKMWTFYVELMEIKEPTLALAIQDLFILKASCRERKEDFQFESNENNNEKESGLFEDDIFEGFDDFNHYE